MRSVSPYLSYSRWSQACFISGDRARAPCLRKDYTKRTLNISTFTIRTPFKLSFKGEGKGYDKNQILLLTEILQNAEMVAAHNHISRAESK